MKDLYNGWMALHCIGCRNNNNFFTDNNELTREALKSGICEEFHDYTTKKQLYLYFWARDNNYVVRYDDNISMETEHKYFPTRRAAYDYLIDFMEKN